jgi:hypothetical protein
LIDVDGFFAVLLWWDFKRNKNQKALETLLAYNIRVPSVSRRIREKSAHG